MEKNHVNNDNHSNYFNQKEHKRQQRKIERQIEQCETRIETFETQITDIDEQLTQPEVFNNPQKSHELSQIKSDTEQKLEQTLIEWEELQEMLLN